MVVYYPHNEGLLYLRPFWEQQPQGQQATVLKGELKGQGPWKIADAVISLVGCQGTDAELAQQLADWEFHLQNVGQNHYNVDDIRCLAKEYGALI